MIDLDKLEAIAKAAPQGEWEVWTSNSWRRVMARDKGDVARVIEPTTHPMDKLPDLIFGGGVEAYLEAMQPSTILALIAEVRAARATANAEVPEGCTPADARKLREANHRLADENDQQARTIAFLRDQNRRIIEAADRIRDGAACAADDAARYRWLRRQAVEVKNYASGNPSWEIDWALRGESFEAAVDTARKAEIERIDCAGGEA